ncbi:MAG: hypothetical protein KTR31_42080, partial [Myxococcales bacterium]|nr:hypothetical protein [Myxococcales bacterium]
MSGNTPWIVLALAFVVGLGATGSYTVPLLTWLAPVLMLRFTRSQPALRGYVLASLVSVPILAITWNLFPFGGTIGLAVFCVVGAFMGSLPLLLDRWLAPGSGPWRIAVYPLASTAMELLGGSGDLGSWGATAYTQMNDLALLQSTSVVGMAGIAFGVGWFATATNALWESAQPATRGWRPLAAFGLTFLALHAWGSLRLSLAPTPQTARVALITADRFPGTAESEVARRYTSDVDLTDSDLQAIRAFHRDHADALLHTAQVEARAGAQLVAWPEGSAVLLDVDEAAFVLRAQALAREHGTVLALALAVLDTGPAPRRLTNKVVMVGTDGTVASEYLKAIPTPGAERRFSHRGDGQLVTIDTPIGRIASVICYDADFPSLVAQASEQDVDLLVVPAGDWSAIAQMH